MSISATLHGADKRQPCQNLNSFNDEDAASNKEELEGLERITVGDFDAMFDKEPEAVNVVDGGDGLELDATGMLRASSS